MWALQRRGLAMDQVGFLSWVSRVAPGFSKVSTAQIMRADKELFILMAQEITEPIKLEQNGTSADQTFRALTRDPRILVYLTPLPVGKGHKEDQESDSKKRPLDEKEKPEKPDKKLKKPTDPKRPPPQMPKELARKVCLLELQFGQRLPAKSAEREMQIRNPPVHEMPQDGARSARMSCTLKRGASVTSAAAGDHVL